MALFICLLSSYLGALIFSVAAVPNMLSGRSTSSISKPNLTFFWRRTHKLAVLGGLAFTITAAFASIDTALPKTYALMLVSLAALMSILFFTSFLILPDANQESVASLIDEIGVLNMVLIISGIVIGILLIAALVYVLPGQFTFWRTAN
jgi:hypothetical protein